MNCTRAKAYNDRHDPHLLLIECACRDTLQVDLSCLQLTAVGDDHSLGGLAGLGAHGLDALDDVKAFLDAAVHAVLAIQPRGGHGADEELGAVGVRAGVGHGQDARLVVLHLVVQVLVGELHAVDGFTTRTVTGSEVTTLAHEFRNDAVESGALEVQRLAGLAHTLFTGAQGAEVGGGLRHDVVVQFEHNAAGGGAADGHVEENGGAGHFESLGR